MDTGRKIAVSCGGTGGHFYPGLAVALSAREDGIETLLLLAGARAVDFAGSAGKHDLDFRLLPECGVPGGIMRSARFAFDTARSVRQAVRILREFRPDALLCMGSYTSVSTVLAARLEGIPIFLHDANACIGRANIFLSRWAREIFLSLPPVNGKNLKCPYRMTGMPLRPSMKACPKSEAVAQINDLYGLNLAADRICILLTGGSQGARALNEKIPGILKELENRSFQVLHLCGRAKSASAEKAYGNAGFPFFIVEETDRMELFYSTADLVVSRAGGSTIAEMAAFAKFAILVPYPHARGHQSWNAGAYSESGAARVVEECDIETELPGALAEFFEAPLEYIRRGKKAETAIFGDAAKNIVDNIGNALAL